MQLVAETCLGLLEQVADHRAGLPCRARGVTTLEPEPAQVGSAVGTDSRATYPPLGAAR